MAIEFIDLTESEPPELDGQNRRCAPTVGLDLGDITPFDEQRRQTEEMVIVAIRGGVGPIVSYEVLGTGDNPENPPVSYLLKKN